MPDAPTPLTDAEVDELEAKAKAATPGPYFAVRDPAEDSPAHTNSGLAMVDTGRLSDWTIARLCEWKTAKYLAALDPSTIQRLIAEVREARKEPTDEHVEKVARAIWERTHDGTWPQDAENQDSWRADARAAIDAMRKTP